LEEKIAADLERILKKNVDLLVLNRAKPYIAWNVIKKGSPF
jgi:predicted nucleotidyltransferase